MNSLILVIFFAVAALTLVSALLVVTVQNIVHAALWLIVSFFGVAGLYLLMEAEFLAVVQLLIYGGGLSILIIIAIMLTPEVSGENVRQLYDRWWVGLVVVGALFGLLIVPTVFLYDWNVVPPALAGEPVALATARELGTALVREYLLAFEVAAILLLVALIGAIVVVYEDRRQRRRVLTLAEEVALRQRQQRAGNGTTEEAVRVTTEEVPATNDSADRDIRHS